MSWYRRWRQPGGVYFFTVVTHHRRALFLSGEARHMLRCAIEVTRAERPFELLAIVLLRDHLHTLWKLPPDDDDYSTRWRLVKSRFTRSLLAAGHVDSPRSSSRRRRGEHTVWQRRGWEHVIRNEHDWKQHLDYIHYNPVKHGFVTSPADWAYSTFSKYVRLGEYDEDWGCSEPGNLQYWKPPGGSLE